MSTESGHVIRVARPAEYDALALIEDAADALFATAGVHVPDIPADPASYAEDHVVLVAGDPAVGVARVNILDGLAYLDQLAVLPTHGRRGIGSALVEAVTDWAGREGYDGVTLTTFRDVPFNGPFYARLGFRVLADGELTAGLQAHREHEAAIGLDAQGPRVAMRRDLAV